MLYGRPGHNDKGEALLSVFDDEAHRDVAKFRLRYLPDTHEVVLLQGDEAIYSGIVEPDTTTLTKTRSARKRDWIEGSSTEVLQRVIAGSDPEHEADLASFPLADRVHISGLGEVYKEDIRAEIKRRAG